jgi:hypothetical protein
MAVDYIVENSGIIWRLFGRAPTKSEDRKNKINDLDRGFMDDAERLVFILGMIVAPITALIASSSSSLPSAVRDHAGLLYLCGRMSQICLVASAIVVSLNRMDGQLFPQWIVTLLVIVCVAGSIAGSFVINQQYSHTQMGSASASTSSSMAAVHTALIIFVAGVTLLSCSRWALRLLARNVAGSNYIKSVCAISRKVFRFSSIAPASDDDGEEQVDDGGAGVESDKNHPNSKSNNIDSKRENDDEGENVPGDKNNQAPVDMYLLSQVLHIAGVMMWMAVLVLSSMKYLHFADLTVSDLCADVVPCIALQALMLIVSMRLVKFKAVDALVSHYMTLVLLLL